MAEYFIATNQGYDRIRLGLLLSCKGRLLPQGAKRLLEIANDQKGSLRSTASHLWRKTTVQGFWVEPDE